MALLLDRGILLCEDRGRPRQRLVEVKGKKYESMDGKVEHNSYFFFICLIFFSVA